MKMTEHFLTVGLFDKNTENQEITRENAQKIISEILINKYSVFAFTMIDCFGVYKMQSTGSIVGEPSIRIEIAADNELTKETIYRIIKALKEALNQESIMYKVVESEVEFA